jgi:hypothetical protein
MLTAFQEEAVRTMARKKTYQKIYDLMDTDDIEEIKAVSRRRERERETERRRANMHGPHVARGRSLWRRSTARAATAPRASKAAWRWPRWPGRHSTTRRNGAYRRARRASSTASSWRTRSG